MSLELRDVTKRFGGRRVLDNLCWQVAPGEVALLTGGNGAGKTTLLRIVTGLLQPDGGEIVVCGHALLTQPVAAKRSLGYLPDGLEVLPDLLVSEFLTLVASLKGASLREPEEKSKAASRSALGVPQLWGQRLRSLSLGQRKRVALAAAILGAPSLLVLDEPTNGLDPDGVTLLGKLIEERRQAGVTTVISTNDKAFASQLQCARYHLEAGTLERVNFRSP